MWLCVYLDDLFAAADCEMMYSNEELKALSNASYLQPQPQP